MSRMKKIGPAAAGVAVAGAVALGAPSFADAVTGSSATSTANPGAGSSGSEAPRGTADTPVTGSELAKVTAAMKAKDSSVTVTSVRKDPDGSYDVFGTKAGAQVRYDVSADLKTFSQGGGGHGGDGPGSSSSSPSA